MEQRPPSAGAATVIAIDNSWSTERRGSFESIKSTALALMQCFKEHYPANQLSFLKFSAYAEAIQPDAIESLTCDENMLGSNMHHAFILAHEWLQDRPESTKELILLTDGEPTAHLERGRSYFSYPPQPRTYRETSAVMHECARAGIDIWLCLTDPVVFASNALRWSLGGDEETVERIWVIPSNPQDLTRTVPNSYALRKGRRDLIRPWL